MGNDILLELSTQSRPRKAIKIDDQRYEIRNRDEFDIPTEYRIVSAARAIQQNQSLETEQAAMTAASSLDTLFCEIVIGGKEVCAKLRPAQKAQVIQVFLAQAGPEPARPMQDSGTLSESSPASNDSMEAVSVTG